MNLRKETKRYKNFIETMFFIVNKDSKRVPFILNPTQLLYLNTKTDSDIILKSRKRGFSSLILAMFMVDFLIGENVFAVVMSHEKEATKRLFQKAKYFFDSLPPDLRPKLETESKNELYFTARNNRYWVGTAGTKAFGRGDDISHLHVSECAFYENFEILTGLFEARINNAYTVIETTANGVNNKFHRLWKRARREDEDCEWTPRFFSWGDDPNCRKEVPNSFRMTEEEKELARKYVLIQAQIYWRRKKIASMVEPEKFPQEYPLNEKEAFLSSGRAVFDSKVLEEMDNAAAKIKPIVRGDIKVYKDKATGLEDVYIEPNEKGSVKIFEYPKEAGIYKERYVAGADPSGGVVDGDYSTIVIRDKITGHQVATYNAKTSPDIFAEDLNLLCRFYQNALLAVESNNYGEAVLNKLAEVLRYPNLYCREKFDEISRKRTKKLGWRNNNKTKQVLISNQQELIRERETTMYDPECIEQHLSYVVVESEKSLFVKMEAQSGAFDDFVISDSLANMMIHLYPKPGKIKRIKTYHRMPTSSGY